MSELLAGQVPHIEVHKHGIALARPLLRALVLALAGAACFLAPWLPAAVAGALLLALAALIAVVAVARWDRTHLAVTGNALVVEYGFLRRRSASISLSGTVFEVERTLLGRLLGYGTVVAGELEIDCVPRRLTRVLQDRKSR
jgi:membrane protein YdbS with pleckstrin-like domain